MNHAPLEWLRTFILDYGYWAVALALLSESAGIPVPGEITLLLASFLAYSEHRLHLASIIVVATCATTLGGDLGYVLGYYGGRPVLDRYQSLFRIPPAALKRGEEMLARYGAATTFFARFVFGMRTFAGPLAGVLRMRWRAFALFNFLGAAVWVTFIASTGFLFGHHWRSLVRVMQRLNVAALMIAVAVVLFLWLKNRRQKPADG